MQSLSSWARAANVQPGSDTASDRLAEAYRKTFTGTATREDAEIVLVDLAVYTRFYETLSPDAPDAALRGTEGRRAVMRWLVGFIADPRLLGELQVAALAEALEMQQS